MTRLRLGTRGSDLAVTQSRWLCDRLREAHPGLEIEEIIIKTHGDIAATEAFNKDWPVGSFVSALENALLNEDVDFAVHSFKDMQTAETPGLRVAAIPGREDVHDVLITREAVADVRALPEGMRVGTSSPRRSAQMKVLSPTVEIVPIRGNVPTRVAKIETEGLDGVILAAAGMKRLGITTAHSTLLPLDVFVPSPAQGALAVQTRVGTEAETLVSVLDDAVVRQGVYAEREFLSAIGAGCHTPAGALAKVDDGTILLHAQLFSDDGVRMVECHKSGSDPIALGQECADELLDWLGSAAG